MKVIGILILAAGLLLCGYALNMDVGVDVPAHDYGDGISTTATRVANVDRMAQRQNLVILGGFLSLAGAVLAGFASMRPNRPAQAVADQAETAAPLSSSVPSSSDGPISISICPSCRHHGDGAAVECARCGVSLTT
jgi:hypothetical protein